MKAAKVVARHVRADIERIARPSARTPWFPRTRLCRGGTRRRERLRPGFHCQNSGPALPRDQAGKAKGIDKFPPGRHLVTSAFEFKLDTGFVSLKRDSPFEGARRGVDAFNPEPPPEERRRRRTGLSQKNNSLVRDHFQNALRPFDSRVATRPAATDHRVQPDETESSAPKQRGQFTVDES